MTPQNYWWEKPKGSVYETIFSIIRFLEQNQGYRREMNLRHLRLYANLNVLGLSARSYALTQTGGSVDRVTLNIIQMCCDTVTQKIAKDKVKPKFLTANGDWSKKLKAKRLEKFVDGMFYETKFRQKEPKAFLASTVFGTGALQIFKKKDFYGKSRIGVEPVFIDELHVDDDEAMYGDPRNIYRAKFISRDVLLRAFPKHTSAIMSAKSSEGGRPKAQSLSDNLLVVEAFHLPSSKDAKDGRHALAIETGDLSDDKYTKDYFPYLFHRFSDPMLGFFGQGLAEQLTGLQVEINKILRTIQIAFHLTAIPKWMIEMGSAVVRAHINNEIGGLMYYKGTMPELKTFSPIAPEVFAHLDRLIGRAFDRAGISALSAAAKKPEGLDSGKALREYHDIEAERFILLGQSREELHMDAARMMVDLAKEIDEEEGGFEVASHSKVLEKIKWKDVNLEADEYVTQVFPTSFLSSTPAGRLNDIKDLAQVGDIDKRSLMRLLDFPDLEGFTSLATAAIDDIDHLIERIVEKGDYQPPEPFQDLQFGIQMMQSAYLKYKNDDLPEDRLELMRRWMEEASAKLSPPQAPSPGPSGGAPQITQGMPAGQPTAVPQAPGQSDMLPTMAGAQ